MENQLTGLRAEWTVVLKDEHLVDSRAVQTAAEKAGRSAASTDESWAALRAEHWEYDSVGTTVEPKVAQMALLMAAQTGNLTAGWSVDSKAAVRAVHWVLRLVVCLVQNLADNSVERRAGEREQN